MRIIITGGSGLIGRALAADLDRAGQEVIILSRRPELLFGLPERVRAEKWDGRSGEGWYSLVEDASAIVNLAGESIASGRWTAERKRAILQSRLHAGQAIVEAVEASAGCPGVVIQASGVGYYGPCQDEVVTEEAPAGDDFLSRLAVDWEDSTAPLETFGVRRVVVRTGVVLSAQGGALPRMLLPVRFYVGGHLGSGHQWFPWIHINDEVRAIRFLIENEAASGPFNLTAPSPLTNAGFTRLLGQQLKRPSLLPAPEFALRLLFGEMSTVLLDGQQAIPKRLQQLGFTFKFPELSLALKDLLNLKS